MTDYTIEAMETNLHQLRLLESIEITNMAYESEFLLACQESGYVGLLEATKESVFKDLVDAGKRLIEKITSMFRQKAIDRYNKQFGDKTLANLVANVEVLKENSQKLGTQSMLPYWEGVIAEKEIIQAINAFNNVTNGKVGDYSFAKAFGIDEKLVKAQDTRLSNMLKNYFRCGKAVDSVKTIKYNGRQIGEHIETMLKYIEDYPKRYADIPIALGKKYDSAVSRVKLKDDKEVADKLSDDEIETIKIDPKDVDIVDTDGKTVISDSFIVNPDTYLSILECTVAESPLRLAVNYPVFEATNKKKDGPVKGADGSTVAPTSIQSDDDDNTVHVKSTMRDISDSGDSGSGEKASTKISMSYYKDIDYFVKLAISAYQTVLEERFVVYGKLITMVAPGVKKGADNATANANGKAAKKGLFKRSKKAKKK